MAGGHGDLGELNSAPFFLGSHKLNLQAVPSAFVPVMKTVISGVEVDLLFARVNLPEAGDKLDIEKDEILRGVDDASQRSLNGEQFKLAMLMTRTSSDGYDT
jgi:poly(A) polymerase Pap1